MSMDKTFEIINLKKKISELEAENKKLKTDTSLAEAHKAMEPFIAGGSEYTGIGGLIRAIKEVGEAKRENLEMAKQRIIQRNKLQSQLDLYKAEFAALQEFIDSKEPMNSEDVDVSTQEGTNLLTSINHLRAYVMAEDYIRFEEKLKP